jgi:hypothetical protein
VHVVVCHSPHARCGVREYGLALDRVLSSLARVTATTAADLDRATSGELDAILVHFEPGIIPDSLRQRLQILRARGVKIVFCCHWFEPSTLRDWSAVVDRFVVHRSYGITDSRVVEIPLGCAVYEPKETIAAVRARLGLPIARTVVTTLGFLAEWKRLPDIVRALALARGEVFVNIQTPLPFQYAGNEEAKLRTAMTLFAPGTARLSTEFIDRKALLDFAYASDLGFLFHAIHTNSASAATKPFVSARCPLVITSSSHTSDLRAGIERVEGFDPAVFAQRVVSTARDQNKLSALKAQMQREYARMNMTVVAAQYFNLLKQL